MVRAIDFWILAGGLLLAIFVLLEVGRRIGIHRRRVDPEHSSSGLGALEGAVFGLMGLLIAFTFSGAANRFDGRREMIGREANAIGTAYLRIDLLPAAAQPALRQDFRDYLDLRLRIFRVVSKDYKAALQDFTDSTELQTKIWNASISACQQQNSPAVTTLVLSSMNEMIDIATTRLVAQQTHPPEVVFYGLGMLVLATSLLAGYGMAGSKKRSFIHMTVYAVIMASHTLRNIDLEYPRFGLIRIDSADQVLVNVRNSMN